MPAIFAFDFSMIKPAMVSYINGKVSFYVWPANIPDKTIGALCDCGVNVNCRNLPTIKELSLNEHMLILEHVKRAVNLADMIRNTILSVLTENNIPVSDDVIIANEGFAFGAKGDAVLDLSGYKYILMKTLMDVGFRNFKTYAPTTIKATAGCSKKGLSGKDKMIMAIANEPEGIHHFCDMIITSPELLKKKTSFMECVDDLADAYWCLKTVIKKEKINCSLNV